MNKLCIWKLEQDENNSWDTYDSCVVVSESEEKAKRICPDDTVKFNENLNCWVITRAEYQNGELVNVNHPYDVGWASSPDKVKATLIGEAAEFLKEGSVICTSFNAGVI